MKIFKLNKDKTHSFKDIWFEKDKTSTPSDHSDINLQDNYSETDVIWRYMDLSKFLSILEDRKLYLTRLDKFDDKYEGGYPIEDFLINSHKLLGYPGENLFTTSRKDFIDALTVAYKYGFYANCWHMNNCDSFGMWKAYLTSPEGIAIKTTVGNLKKSVLKDNKDWVTYGKVEYIDYENESIISVAKKKKELGINIPPFPVFFKRKNFEYENEFRVMSMYEASLNNTDDLSLVNKNLMKLKLSAKDSIQISIDLNEMVQEIYVSPFAGAWYYNLICKLAERYDLKKTILRSAINAMPIYE